MTQITNTRPRHRAALNFTRHYAEMVAAMLVGMFALGIPLAAGLTAIGIDVDGWHTNAPALELLGMAFTMTVPMVAWMRHRGHGWQPAWEMSAAMFLPSFAAIALLWTGVVVDADTLLVIQHSVMFPAMLVAMLLRPSEYTGHHA